MPRNGLSGVAAVKAQLDMHEAVCAERYSEIRESLIAIRNFLSRSVLSLIAGLLVAIGAILLRLFETRGIL
jgi:hypothetical protein